MNTFLRSCLAAGVALCTPLAVAAAPAFDTAAIESAMGLKGSSMRAGGINIVAIYQQMVQENPRFMFLHYWGQGRATDPGVGVRRALDSQHTLK